MGVNENWKEYDIILVYDWNLTCIFCYAFMPSGTVSVIACEHKFTKSIKMFSLV